MPPAASSKGGVQGEEAAVVLAARNLLRGVRAGVALPADALAKWPDTRRGGKAWAAATWGC